MSNGQAVKDYINEQIAQIDFRSRAYVFDSNNKKRPTRDIFETLQSHFEKYINGNRAYRWVTLSGLRGAGKTTLLYQLYHKNKDIDGYFLILSMDEAMQTVGASIADILEGFEEIVGRSLTNLDKPLFLFIDEVQNDPKWGIILKTIYDKTDKVFVFSTGSAALLMNMNADMVRRAIVEKIHPLSFTEYAKIKHGKNKTKGLAEELRDIFFLQKDARDVYTKLKEKESAIEKYYLGLSRLDFENYLYYGSLPFMIALDNESIIYDQIARSLERVIYKDIPQLDSFSTETISKIPAILYAVAGMDAFNFSTLANRFEISRLKVGDIFNVLERTEILNRIYPYGSHFNQVTKKPSKYLFSSPAFRSMYFRMIGNMISKADARGKLLEDLVGMFLCRVIDRFGDPSLAYDSAKGGADFILRNGDRKIVLEIGSGSKDYRQVAATQEKTSARYGLVISKDNLQYSEEKNAVKIPLRYFILI